MSIQIHETGSPDASTIVFLHAMGFSSWMWTEQIAALNGGYHCVAVDLPGSGDSYEDEWHSFADTAAQIADVIRTKSASGKAHIVGLSLGGYQAVYLLRDHPDVVESMVISGVTPRPLPNRALWRFLSQVVMPPLLTTSVGSSLMAKMQQLPPDATALYKKDAQRLTRQTIERTYREIITFELPPELRQRPQRVLAVAAEHDVGLIKEGLQDFLALLPNSEAVIAPKAHHGWNGEFPQLFADMIRAWIERKPLPPSLVPVSKGAKSSPLTASA